MAGGTTSKEKSELPQWYVDYAKPSLDLANQVAQIGYVPSVGPEVAAFNPTQVDAMQQGNNWSAAFNTPGQAAPDVQSQLMPTNSQFMGQGAYSSGPEYEKMKALFAQMFPGQNADIARFSKNPVTGAPATAYGSFPGGANVPVAPVAPPQNRWSRDDRNYNDRASRGSDSRGRGNSGRN